MSILTKSTYRRLRKIWHFMAQIGFNLSNQMHLSSPREAISDNQFVTFASGMQIPASMCSEPLTVLVFVIQRWIASDSKHLFVALGTLDA